MKFIFFCFIIIIMKIDDELIFDNWGFLDEEDYFKMSVILIVKVFW